MDYLFFYLLQVAEFIDILTIILIVLIAALIIFATAIGTAMPEIFDDTYGSYEGEKVLFQKLKKVICSLLIAVFFLFLVPSKQTLILFGATYLGKKAVNITQISDKLQKVNTIIDLELDKRIKELTND